MSKDPKPSLAARRQFLSKLGRAAVCTGAAVGAGALGVAAGVSAKTEAPAQGGSFPTKDYDWTKHQWAFGVDATKCIGCLRCVEACKVENHVPRNAHQFRTWVERYVYLEGEEKARIDSQQDPVNIEASGSQKEYRFANRYKDKKVEKAFFVPKLCNQCTHPACVQVCPVGATFSTEDGVVLVDSKRCIGCRYCIQACPYGARYLHPETRTADKCTFCYHRIVKGLLPACVEVCPTQARVFGDLKSMASRLVRFKRTKRIHVLKAHLNTEPKVYYGNLDGEVR